MAVRDLSEKEMDEAILLADHLWRKQGPNEFVLSCKSLAKNRLLTRGQFEALRHATQTENTHDSWERPAPIIPKRRPSKRPITLYRGE